MSILSVCLEVAQGKGCRKHKECLTVVCEGQQVGNTDANNVNLIFFILWTVFMSQRGDESLTFMSLISDFILVLCGPVF